MRQGCQGFFTGPVDVEFALLFHVPTRSVGVAMACACACRTAPPQSSSAASLETMAVFVYCVASVGRSGNVCGGRVYGGERLVVRGGEVW